GGTDHARPVVHDAQPHAALFHHDRRKTHAIIVHHEGQAPMQDRERDHNVLGLTMLHRIVDRFLHDTIHVDGHGVIGNVDGVITADLAREVKQCLHTGG